MNRTILFSILFTLTLALNGVSQQSKSDSLIHELVKTSDSDTLRVNVLIRLADQLSRESSLLDALQQIQLARELAERLSYDKGIAEARLYTGIIHYRAGDYIDALSFLHSALPDYEVLKDKNAIALTHHWLGNAYYNLSRYDEALDHYLQSYSIREMLRDVKGMSFTLSNIANVFMDQQEYTKALDYYLKSLELKKQLKDESSMAVSYNNIANVYSGLQQYDKALQYSENALAIFKRLNDDRRAGFAWGNIGEIYEKQGRYDEAMTALLAASQLLEKAGDTKALAEAFNHIGSVQMQLKQFRKAEVSLQKAQALAREANVPSELIENYLHLARLDSAQGKLAEAYVWMKQYTELKEKVFNAEKSKQIARMQTAFDSERKDKAIQLLEREKDYEKGRKMIFIAAIVVLLLIAAGLVYFLRVQRKANRNLKKQKKQLEELNQLKDKLFSIIAHDLRSPLQSLKGVLNLAGKDVFSGEELKHLLGTIGTNTQNTIDLVDNLINWSRDNLSGSTIQPELFDLREPVQLNTKLLAAQSEAKKIQLMNAIVDKLMVTADKNMIDLVLRNLISNAIKFTPAGGTVSITSVEEKASIILEIKDSGVGILPEQQQKLFGTHNYSTRGTANEKGTGLGLILCREFVEKNGGRIWVESEWGKGSKFCFSLRKQHTSGPVSIV